VFFEPQQTPFDLHWRMFGIEVRVHPMFWLMSVLLGWPAIDLGVEFLLMWVLCVFVSILVHELGHVVAGRLFGSDGYIVLYSFGGLAIGSSDLPRRWQRNIVYFAGPLAGFLLFGLLVGGILLFLPGDERAPDLTGPVALFVEVSRRIARAGGNPLLLTSVLDLIEINLFWGLLNLLPIWPLDGGRISRESCEWLLPRQGTRIAFLLSGVTAALLALNSLVAASGRQLLPYVPAGGWYSAIFFGMLALASFQLYQAENNRWRYGADDSESWEDLEDDGPNGRGRWDR
jgi:Zn-dependent protease